MTAVIGLANNTKALAYFRGIDGSVAARGLGQTREQRERWIFHRLVCTLIGAHRVKFPLRFEIRDRPDFVLQSNHQYIGIEATEAGSEKFSEFISYRNNKTDLNEIILCDLGVFRKNSAVHYQKMNKSAFEFNKLLSPPWVGDEIEQEWATYVYETVAKKINVFQNSDFRKFPQNWLAIFDNTPLSDVNLDRAISILIMRLKRVWSHKAQFDMIFVEHGNEIISLSKEGSERLSLQDYRRIRRN